MKRETTNNIRSLPYPVFEIGNDSYPDCEYSASGEALPSGDKATLCHDLSNAGLIKEMLDSGAAVYGCAVASPKSGFRRFYESTKPEQTVPLESDRFGEPPWLTPMIVCKREESRRLDSARHGVHEDWDGLDVTFPRGARLAQGNLMKVEQGGWLHMLYTEPDASLAPGQFWVEAEAGDYQFRFRAKCNPDVHNLVQAGHNPEKKRDLLIHIVTACLAALQRDHRAQTGEDGDSEPESDLSPVSRYPALQALQLLLQEKFEELKKEDPRRSLVGASDWTQDDFQPEFASTLLYPHKIIRNEDDDDE